MKNKHVFLLLGPEKGKKQIFIDEITNSLTSKNGETPEIYRFYPFETDVREVVALLENGSLFSKAKIVIIRMVEQLKGKKDLEILANYIEHPSKNSILILESDSIGDVSAVLKRKVPESSTKIFWEMYESDKRGWIINYFRKKGIKIDIDAVNELLELVENNTMDLEQECEKLFIYFKNKGAINSSDVEEHLYHSKEENVFTLFSRMASRDLEGALEILSKILLSRKSAPDQIVLGTLWQIERLMSLKAMIENGLETGEALKKLGITNKRSKLIYTEASKNYTVEEVATIIRLINDTVFKLRSFGTGLQTTIVQLFFYYAIVKGGKGYWKQVTD